MQGETEEGTGWRIWRVGMKKIKACVFEQLLKDPEKLWSLLLYSGKIRSVKERKWMNFAKSACAFHTKTMFVGKVKSASN